MRKSNFFWLVVLICAGLYSCMGPKYKPGTSAPPAKLMEEFFVKAGLMQYFIKPLSWTSGKSKVSGDFTFRDSSGVKSTVTFNLSVPDFRPDSVILVSGAEIFRSKASTIFEERKKNGMVLVRVGTKIPFSAMKALVESGIPLKLKSAKGDLFEAIPESRTKRKMKQLSEILFTN